MLEPTHDSLLEVLQTIAEDVVLKVVEIEVVGGVGIVGRHLLERDIRIRSMVRLDQILESFDFEAEHLGGLFREVNQLRSRRGFGGHAGE